MSGSHRVTRRFAAAGFAALLAAGFAAPSVAIAAEGDSERGFPELLPEWYVTAPAVPYGIAAPAPTVDDSLKSEGIHVAYFQPGGGAPAKGQGDLELSYLHSPTATATDEARIDFEQFEDLTTALGTTFTDALYLPLESTSGTAKAINEVAQAGGVYFDGTALVVDRQAEPCAVKSMQPAYEFQVALLGSNGYKYLADVAVNLGERPQSACATESKPKPATPSTVEEPAADTTLDEAEEPAPEAAEAETLPITEEDDTNWIGWATLAAVVGVIALVLTLFFRRPSKKLFNDEGELLTPPIDPRVAVMDTTAAVEEEPPSIDIDAVFAQVAKDSVAKDGE